jgi:hypothetical protein
MSLALALADACVLVCGRKCVFPGTVDFTLAAQAWLLANRPQGLESHAKMSPCTQLDQDAHLLWSALNFLGRMPIDAVWAAAKVLTALSRIGRRAVVVTAAGVHKAPCTGAGARAGLLQTRWGSTAPGPEGLCPSAAALHRHALISARGGSMRRIAESSRLQRAMTVLNMPEGLLEAKSTTSRNAMPLKQAQAAGSGRRRAERGPGGVGKGSREEEEG